MLGGRLLSSALLIREKEASRGEVGDGYWKMKALIEVIAGFVLGYHRLYCLASFYQTAINRLQNVIASVLNRNRICA